MLIYNVKQIALEGMRMVEVYKTSVAEIVQATALVAILQQGFPGCKITFDLEDCDNILRIEGKDFNPEKVLMLVEENGFNCQILE